MQTAEGGESGDQKELSENLTGLLQLWKDGDASALNRLVPVVYSELHRLASIQMAGERPNHLLQPSALVNEAFLRLMGNAPVEWANRANFYAVSARLMRQILVDFARAEDAQKRGGRMAHLDSAEPEGIAEPSAEIDTEDLVAIDEALTRLEQLDGRQAKVVELRFFGGLENGEIARVLGVSEPTVIRDWRLAKAWLFSNLGPQS